MSADQQALERRAEWLKEDLAVVKRRAATTLCLESNASSFSTSQGHEALTSRIDQMMQELAEERQWRQNLEAELTNVDMALSQERSNREKALGTLSTELEETMKSLVRRIDTGLSESTNELNARAGKAEASLRDLIIRVEEGLVSGAKELTLATGSSTPVGGIFTPGGSKGSSFPASRASRAHSPSKLEGLRPGALPSELAQSLMASLPKMPKSSQSTPSATPMCLQVKLQDMRKRLESSDSLSTSVPSVPRSAPSVSESDRLTHSCKADLQLLPAGADDPEQAASSMMKMWSELQEENMRLRQKRVQLEARQMRSRLASRSPGATSRSFTPQIFNSRPKSPSGGHGNLGTGFRFKVLSPTAKKDDQSDDASSSSIPTSASAYNLGHSSRDGASRQSDTAVSSMPSGGAASSTPDHSRSSISPSTGPSPRSKNEHSVQPRLVEPTLTRSAGEHPSSATVRRASPTSRAGGSSLTTTTRPAVAGPCAANSPPSSSYSQRMGHGRGHSGVPIGMQV